MIEICINNVINIKSKILFPQAYVTLVYFSYPY